MPAHKETASSKILLANGSFSAVAGAKLFFAENAWAIVMLFLSKSVPTTWQPSYSSKTVVSALYAQKVV
jgi:hypothetical protein